jgi:alkylation response protein AidB-like acyl-CoA dehydrogenase
MQLELNGAHRALRDAVREFAQSVARPVAEDVDLRHRWPEEAINGAREMKLMGILLPTELGGAGLDHLAFTLVIEELARACASTAVIVDVHNSVASEPIVLFGSEDQKRRWLPEMASGERLGAFALTEPSSGSDAAALKTTARRSGSEYVLNGSKVFITNVGRAGLYLVFARTGADQRAAGISAFLVPAEAEGVQVGQVFKKMGLNGSPTGELVLQEVRVPAASLLGGEGGGFTVAMRALDSGRIGISGQALGIAASAVEETVRLERESEQPSQGAAFALAGMATRRVAAQQLAYHAAWLCSQGRPFTKEASMAKLFATDAAMSISSEALQLGGPEAASAGQRLERNFRDAKALQIYEGSNQIQRVVIARHLLKS